MKQIKYGLHGKFNTLQGKSEDLAKVLLQAAELMNGAKGCQLYLISKDPTKENEVWVTEVWDSKEEHDASLNTPGVRELIGKAMPLLDGTPSGGQELAILGGIGIS